MELVLAKLDPTDCALLARVRDVYGVFRACSGVVQDVCRGCSGGGERVCRGCLGGVWGCLEGV
jgi:hypothetical protein